MLLSFYFVCFNRKWLDTPSSGIQCQFEYSNSVSGLPGRKTTAHCRQHSDRHRWTPHTTGFPRLLPTRTRIQEEISGRPIKDSSNTSLHNLFSVSTFPLNSCVLSRCHWIGGHIGLLQSQFRSCVRSSELRRMIKLCLKYVRKNCLNYTRQNSP